MSLVGFVLAIIFYYKAKKEKRPRYYVRTRTLIEGTNKAFPKVELLYNGRPQPRITVSKIVFLNAGRETIDASDVASSDPLRFLIGDEATDVLDVQVVKSSRPANRFEVSESDTSPLHTVYLKFDFVDPKDGVVIQVLHDGDESTPVELAGHIKGATIKKLRALPRFDPFFFIDAALERLPKAVVLSGAVLFYFVTGAATLLSSLVAESLVSRVSSGFVALVCFAGLAVFLSLFPKLPIINLLQDDA